MKIIVAIDERNGMLFHHRRQSKDVLLQKKILEMTKDVTLWMNSYSSGQFESLPKFVKIDEDFMEKALDRDYCFVENISLAEFAGQIKEVILCKWNRHYPGDFYLDFLPKEHGMSCIMTEEFPGNSHEKITLEVWK